MKSIFNLILSMLDDRRREIRVEDELYAVASAEPDAVAVLQQLFGYLVVVDERPGSALEVANRVRRAVESDLRMDAGDVRVIQCEVVLFEAANSKRRAVEVLNLPFPVLIYVNEAGCIVHSYP